MNQKTPRNEIGPIRDVVDQDGVEFIGHRSIRQTLIETKRKLHAEIEEKKALEQENEEMKTRIRELEQELAQEKAQREQEHNELIRQMVQTNQEHLITRGTQREIIDIWEVMFRDQKRQKTEMEARAKIAEQRAWTAEKIAQEAKQEAMSAVGEIRIAKHRTEVRGEPFAPGKNECRVCFTEYSPEKCVPRIIACGHTFCTKCIINLYKQNSPNPLKCPLCRKVCPNDTNDWDIFPLNYDMYND